MSAPRNCVLALVLLWGLGCRTSAPPTAPQATAPIRAGTVVAGLGGIVASAHPAASAAGAETLRRGGNAVDAAIATAYALAVVEPYSAGLGGGGFLLFWDAKTKRAHVIDYREVAPKAAHRDMYLKGGKLDRRASLEGFRAVAVPGMVPGLAAAQARFGALELKAVLPDAIRLAEEGFEVYESFYEESVDRLDLLRANAAASKAFLKAGAPYPVGANLQQRELAAVLRRLAEEGPRLFTHGAVAAAILAESRRQGGLLTAEDLAGFEPRFREPLVGTYRGRTIITMPPPSSGGVHLLQMLGMLEQDRLRRGRADDRGVLDTHMLVEIMRRAYADRAVFLGDPSFVDVPVQGLLQADYLAGRYASIDVRRATPSASVSAGRPGGLKGPVVRAAPKETPETTHLTVIDAEGSVVSLTQTVNYGFGAGVVVPGTGILLNNEMDDFSAAPGTPNVFGLVGGEANAIAPGKIPLSSMTPTIVLEDGAVRLALGSPGGSRIITAVLQAIVHVIDDGLSLEDAIAQPRLHMQWRPDHVRIEPDGLEPEVRDGLEALGHKIVERKHPWGNATGIEVVEEGMRIGVADPRGDGGAAAE